MQLDLVPRDPAPRPGGAPLVSGEYYDTPQQFSWPSGPRSQTAASGSSGATPLTQPFQAGGSALAQVPLTIPGPGDGLGPDQGCLPDDDHVGRVLYLCQVPCSHELSPK